MPARSTSPPIAHKVIGVGNFDVRTQAQIGSQSRGPAPDNRFKPDIQALTNTETASNGCGWQQNCTTDGSDTAINSFGGTSGAAPYAASAAALLRSWLRGTSFSIDPGQVYAQLILSGQQPYPFNNTSGAGSLRLPTDGWALWGKVTVNNGDTIEIPIGISDGSPNTLDAALWWPETAVQPHNDVDLSLDPGGTVRVSSTSIPSVFERVCVSGSVSSGTWKVRIRGYSVPAGTQTVTKPCMSNGIELGGRVFLKLAGLGLMACQLSWPTVAADAAPIRVHEDAEWYWSRPERESRSAS